VDVNNLKGRIAEALVESIFQRALYRVARVGRESHVQGLLKSGAGEFAPDFLVWKPVQGQEFERDLHRMMSIEVKYRSNLRAFVKNDLEPLVARVRGQWPELYCVLVTDDPGERRSCFQVFDVKEHVAGTDPVTLDLDQHRALDIYATTVREYEGLAREIFSLLGAYDREQGRQG